jgi:hypothetical protein
MMIGRGILDYLSLLLGQAAVLITAFFKANMGSGAEKIESSFHIAAKRQAWFHLVL